MIQLSTIKNIYLEGRLYNGTKVIAQLNHAGSCARYNVTGLKSLSASSVALRLGACDYVEGGSIIEDSILASIEFEKAGIDLLDISGGLYGYINPTNKEQGYFSHITEFIKKNIAIPVILTGGIKDINVAEKLIEENKADLIGVGRTILKDSNWAKNSLSSL